MENKALSRYFSILQEKEKPKFQLAKQSGLLDRKIKEAREILKSCEFCERKCKVNRLQRELGFCKAGKDWKIFGAHTHLGEERELIPSATLFLAGCSLRCCYCQNAPDSVTPEIGEKWQNEEVVKWTEMKYREGCKNVNFVTPDCYVWNILKVLNKVEVNIPVVWNSSSYYSEKTANLIKDIVDIYLLDFRYFNDNCAVKLSSAPNYPAVAKRNFLIAFKDAEILVRVLILPGHTKCCSKPILKWIAKNLGKKVLVNIMPQYRPTWQAYKYKEINRELTEKEFREVVKCAEKLKLNFIS